MREKSSSLPDYLDFLTGLTGRKTNLSKSSSSNTALTVFFLKTFFSNYIVLHIILYLIIQDYTFQFKVFTSRETCASAVWSTRCPADSERESNGRARELKKWRAPHITRFSAVHRRASDRLEHSVMLTSLP